MQPIQIPSFWESLLKRYLKKTFFADTRKKGFADREEFTEGDYRFFSRGVEQLNLSFTRERHFLPKNYFNQKELRSGYLFYFLPVNALKVTALLPPLDLEKPLRILDLGSGPGTGMLGTMTALSRHMKGKKTGKVELSWILIDQNRQALHDAKHFYEAALNQLKKENPEWEVVSQLQSYSGNLFNEPLPKILKPQKMNLILSLNFLGELPIPKRVGIVQLLLREYLDEKGKILIMEPALQKTTRELMELHDEILDRQAGFVFAPCLHQSACPMLQANNRDWCHTYIPWERPPWIEKIDRLVGIYKDYLKCSYLLLGRDPVQKGDPLNWRVVSGPLNSKGKSERLLCGPAGLPHLLRITRLDRDRSFANSQFDSLERGDIVVLPKISRIEKKTVLRRL